MKRIVHFCLLYAIFMALCISTHAQTINKGEISPSVKPIPVEEAIQTGLVKLRITAGRDSLVRLEVQKVSGDNDIKIFFSGGVTRLGFIDAHTIKTGSPQGRTIWGTDTWGNDTLVESQTHLEVGPARATKSYRKDCVEFTLFGIIETVNLAAEGFSLELKHDMVMTLEKGKQYNSLNTKGSLKINVPSEFEPFFLSSLSGSIIEGTISIQPGGGTGTGQMTIRYSNMKVK